MPVAFLVDSASGCMLGYHPSVGALAVDLRHVARELAARGAIRPISDRDLRLLMLAMDPRHEETGGKIARKLKTGLKKAGKDVAKVAKNKLVQTVVSAVAKAVPPPYNVAVMAVEGAAKVGTAIAKGSKRAKQIKSMAQQVARGAKTLPELTATAKRLGVSPGIAASAAVMAKTVQRAKAGDRMAKAALSLSRDLTSDSPSAKVAEAAERAVTYKARGPSGRTYTFTLAS
jgi:hypothetical protein